ncbi:hypothetical protein U1Q18_022476 [Sarracenia purpurea var. burkii]
MRCNFGGLHTTSTSDVVSGPPYQCEPPPTHQHPLLPPSPAMNTGVVALSDQCDAIVALYARHEKLKLKFSILE